MKGDFSRNTFGAFNRFTRVLMQQGRVQVDADWNEQTAILLHYLQTLASDLIGPSGVGLPRHGGPGDGFKIQVVDENKYDFGIQSGNYYVDGILCENAQLVAYSKQLDYPLSDTTNLRKGSYLVYLDVWERHISYIQDDSIREVALGGPDTATRAKLVWQVKVAEVDSETGCNNIVADWASWVNKRQPGDQCRLKAQAKKDGTGTSDPCITSPDARYRGAENQLYRVEIHDDLAGKETFKWSRDNGSVVFPIRALTGKIVTLEHLGLDPSYSLQEGDWVEIVDDDYVLQGRAEVLLKVTHIDRVEMQVTLDKAPASTVGEDERKHPLLRRWDQKGSKAGAVPVEEEKDLHLEDGVQICFELDGSYRSGDYWLIPARAATGDVEWPKEYPQDSQVLELVPQFQPPHGVLHHYAPLAIIAVEQDGTVTVEGDPCHRTFE